MCVFFLIFVFACGECESMFISTNTHFLYLYMCLWLRCKTQSWGSVAEGWMWVLQKKNLFLVARVMFHQGSLKGYDIFRGRILPRRSPQIEKVLPELDGELRSTWFYLWQRYWWHSSIAEVLMLQLARRRWTARVVSSSVTVVSLSRSWRQWSSLKLLAGWV